MLHRFYTVYLLISNTDMLCYMSSFGKTKTKLAVNLNRFSDFSQKNKEQAQFYSIAVTKTTTIWMCTISEDNL